MSANKSAENTQTPQKPSAQIVCPSQKFGILMKKASLGVRSPCFIVHIVLEYNSIEKVRRR